jgi:branched-chain amino acid transport system ATP-binding protein
MLEVKGLSVSYGQHRALDDISVQIAKGEVVVILGANGAGKSSLLRAVAGLSEGHYEGEISFDGVSLLDRTPDEIVADGIALVPEGRAIFGDLNVEENLRLGAYSDRARVNEQANLDRVLTLFPKLRERRKQITRTMSGGEQQMVAIGRALMSDPAILMLDEPSLGLSPLLSKELFQALGQIREAGPGVLVVEQNAKLSLAIADRGYLIENGHIVGANDAASLASDPAVQAAYLGGTPGKRPTQPAAAKAPAASQTSSAIPSSAPTATPTGDKVFIRPAGLGGGAVDAGALIGENLGDLLGRAGAVARPSVRAATGTSSPGQKRPRIIEITPEPEPEPEQMPSAKPPRNPPSNGRVDNDDRIATMLADFEVAAQQARQPHRHGGPSSSGGENGTMAGAQRELPEIPVFRKSRVAVFKRDKDGVLAKAKEV